MSEVARLGAFALLLAAVFGVAVAAGGAVDPETEAADDRAAAGHGHGEVAVAEETPAVRGLAVSDAGLTLQLADRDLPARDAGRLRFRILNRDGRAVRRFAVEHERRMHVIVVRRDGAGFQHLHPRMAADGTWTTPIRIAEPGAYRVFADFKSGSRAITLGADLSVDGEARYRPLPPPADSTTTPSGHRVSLESEEPRAGRAAMLRFTVTKDGHTVHTQPYLGAGGHLVALREGDLAYLHTHPAGHGEGHDDAVRFETTFPSAGRHRLYFQFKVGGRVHTAEFTQEVAR